MAKKQPKPVEPSPDGPVSTDPLPLDKVLLSLSAQFNITARWINSCQTELEQYGGFEAAADCLCAADILLEVVKQWSDLLGTLDVTMPPGIGYIPYPDISGGGK